MADPTPQGGAGGGGSQGGGGAAAGGNTQAPAQPVSNPASPQHAAPILDEHEIGLERGPDLTRPQPAEQTQGDQTQAGTDTGRDAGATGTDKPAGTEGAQGADEVDPAEAYLKSITAGDEANADPDAAKKAEEAKQSQQKELEATGAFEKLKALPAGKLAEALAGLGLDAKDAEFIVNLNSEVGRHRAEVGVARKQLSQFEQARKTLEPVLEFDEKTNDFKGFHGLKLLKMATEKFGSQEVQKQLGTLGLALVTLDDIKKMSAGASNGNGAQAAEDKLLTDVAKKFELDFEGQTPDELFEAVQKHRGASREYQTQLTDMRINQEREVQRQAGERQQAMASLQAENDQLIQSIVEKSGERAEPLFGHMTQLHTTYFPKGQAPTPANITKVIHLAAQFIDLKSTLPKVLADAKEWARRDERRKLGLLEPAGARAGAGAPSGVQQRGMRLPPAQDDLGEKGDDLTGGLAKKLQEQTAGA